MDESPIERAANPQPPRLSHVFDWRLLGGLCVVGLVAAISCDVVNAKLGDKLNAWLHPSGAVSDPSLWTPGAEQELELTLVTKDADRLSCADDRTFESHHCEFKKTKRRWPLDTEAPVDDNKAHIIQPYRTAKGNYLVMVSGLWATPELAMRRHLEPARGVPDANLRRFIARCTLRFLGRMDGVQVRWDYTQKWYTEKWAPVAVAQSCRMVDSSED